MSPGPCGTPSVTFALWAGAWLRGAVSPDAAIEAMASWAPLHVAMAAEDDRAVALTTGLPVGTIDAKPDIGTAALLAAIRRLGPGVQPRVVLPAPGDVTGLTPGTPHAEAAVESGETVVLHRCGTEPGPATAGNVERTCVGLVPVRESADAIRWTAYSAGTPGMCSAHVHYDGLGQARRELREAVREATEALAGLARVGGAGTDARRRVAWLLEDGPAAPLPPGTPARAVEVFDTASTVAAILAVIGERTAGTPQSAAMSQIQESRLRTLASAVRRARTAAASASESEARRSDPAIGPESAGVPVRRIGR